MSNIEQYLNAIFAMGMTNEECDIPDYMASHVLISDYEELWDALGIHMDNLETVAVDMAMLWIEKRCKAVQVRLDLASQD